ELVLLPAEHALLDQALVARRLAQRPRDPLVELLAAPGDRGAGAAEREARADDRRDAGIADDAARVLERACVARARELEADALHRLAEAIAVLRLVDRLELRTDELDTVPLERAGAGEVDREVQRGLAAERRQERVGTLV